MHRDNLTNFSVVAVLQHNSRSVERLKEQFCIKELFGITWDLSSTVHVQLSAAIKGMF